MCIIFPQSILTQLIPLLKYNSKVVKIVLQPKSISINGSFFYFFLVSSKPFSLKIS